MFRPCSVEYGVARVPRPRMQRLIPFRAGIMCYARVCGLGRTQEAINLRGPLWYAMS